MSSEFQREYLVRLPLPIAQLYSRAHNAKDGRARHDNCFYLLEASIKLGGCALIAAYADSLRQGEPRNEDLDKLLSQLAMPSLGQWVGFLRELSRHFGARPDAATHPMGQLWDELNTKRSDLPDVLALFRRIKNGPDGKPAGDKRCSLLQLIDAIVQYRNIVFGHGASRAEGFYADEMGPLLFPAINNMLSPGTIGLLGREGSRMVCIGEIKRVGEELFEVGLTEMIGLRSERTAPVLLTDDKSQGLETGRLGVIWPGRPAPLMLDPLMIYIEDELADDVLILNKDRNGKQVEYLSYSTGKAQRDRTKAPDMARLLARLTGKRIDEQRLAELQQDDSEERFEDFSAASADRSVLKVMGDYEILAEVGRGGMGVVYLARQFSLGRLVALKMLPSQMMSDDVALARFRREVRALGRCDHPNIVKVISSGTMPNGQLYYAMEYVPGADLEQTWMEITGNEGDSSVSDMSASHFSGAVLRASRRVRETIEPTEGGTDAFTAEGDSEMESRESFLDLEAPLPEDIDDTVAEHDLSYTRRVVRLIRDVADALQTVHDQGIVHRDVKPSNLVLTPDGRRVVLMDFGLASSGGQSTAVTRAGGFVGTLRYSAPEQLAAASVAVSAAADVRGLGVTMWELLTRRKLFAEADDEAQLTRLVFEEDVPFLRTIDPSFDRDLEAIVARATERNTSDRIQTARGLCDLIDLYLDNQPLPIRTAGTSELLGRWIRQHRGLVSTAATACLAIIVTVVVAFMLITRSRDHERESRVAAEHAEEQARQSLAEATQARAEAVKQFRTARTAVESSLIQVSEVMQHFPGMQDVRQRLLQQAAGYFTRFAAENSNDPALRAEAAQAQIQLGNVQVRVRDFQAAIDSYQAADRALSELSASLTDGNSDEKDQILARCGVATAYAQLGIFEQASTAFASAISAADELLQTSPDDVDLKRLRAETLQSYATALVETGRAEEAVTLLKQVRDDLAELTGNDDPHDRRGLATTLNLLTQALIETGQSSAAVEQVQTAIATWTALVATDPDDPHFLSGRAAAQMLLTAALQAIGREDEQLAATRATINDYQALADALPDIPTYSLNLAMARTNLAQILNRQGRNPDAQPEAIDALTRLIALTGQAPQSRQYLTEAAAAQTILARVLGELGDLENSIAHFDEAVLKYDDLIEAFPDVSRYREDRAVCRSNLGLVLLQSDDAASARPEFQAAITELDRLLTLARAETDAEPPAYLRDALAHAWRRMGDSYVQTGPAIEATKAYVEALEQREQLTTDPVHLCKLACFLCCCSDPQFRDPPRALRVAGQARDIAPNDPRVLQTVGLAHLRNENWSNAIDALQAARRQRTTPDGVDGLLLALALWKSSEDSQPEARDVFETAAEVLSVNRPAHADSIRIRDEVARVLGIGTQE